MTAPRTEPGITVEGVWKKFRRGERHDSLRDLLPSLARRFARGRGDPAALEARDFWALRDINLEIRPGQALGIIGHNGAGKSTLLKLITRIMRPSLGRCAVRGRIGALIELAAGFHPDLTGRENVFLQGAIMGMPAAVIRNRFDEIVEFAGVADFIDTPVKRYSSGMNARLGFAIAAHLEPEVLIIDEVLSVGDMAFQERAFGRMREIAQSGIPVAVVSHQLDRITALSTHAILLRRGEVVAMGTPTECITQYVTGELTHPDAATTVVPGLEVTGLAAESNGQVRSGDRRTLTLRGRYDPAVAGPRRLAFLLRVRRMDTGQVVFTTSTHRHGLRLTDPGPFAVRFDLQFNVLEGVLSVESVVIDADTEGTLGEGPWAHVEVSPGQPFKGVVQLNPEVTLSSGAG
jgi:ABC-type polysaccharide/polyol phosphate transport system ATPase subunit